MSCGWVLFCVGRKQIFSHLMHPRNKVMLNIFVVVVQMHNMRALFSLFGLCASCAYAALAPLQPFSFSTKGESVEVTGTVNQECKTADTFKADAPGIALALTIYSKRCWSDGRYNAKGFTIQAGVVGFFRAYQISGPKTAPKSFRASKNSIWLSFAKKGSYKIYRFSEAGDLKEIGTVVSPGADQFVKTNLFADAKQILAVAPASARVSVWPQLEDGVEGATVWQDSTFKITGRRWDVSVGQPYDPSVSFQKGPDYWGYRYGISKVFFPVSNKGSEGVVWQDKTSKIFLTWLSGDLLRASHVELPTNGISKPILAAAAGNGQGEVFSHAY